MPDYQNGKIYTIRCKNDTSLVYVGSTTQPLSSRFSGHKRDKNASFSKFVDEDWSNWYIELYEEYKCLNKEQLEKREGEIIREIGTINKRIAGRTKREYYDENKEHIFKQQEIYREVNKEKNNQYFKDYYKTTKQKFLKVCVKKYNVNVVVLFLNVICQDIEKLKNIKHYLRQILKMSCNPLHLLSKTSVSCQIS